MNVEKHALSRGLVAGALQAGWMVARGVQAGAGVQLSREQLMAASYLAASVVGADWVSNRLVFPTLKAVKLNGGRTVEQMVVEPALAGAAYATLIQRVSPELAGDKSFMQIAMQGALMELGASFVSPLFVADA